MNKRILLSFFLLLAATAFSQTEQLKAVVLNYSDLSAVQQLQKLELGIQLPNGLQARVDNFLHERDVNESEKLNPFLEWELAIEAVFTHEATGTMKTIDAFYYREYERDPAANSWKDIGTQYPMRVRFAPPLAGNWSCVVSMSVKGKRFPASGQLDFTVVESKAPGYVSVHANKRNLQRDGELIYPAGVNFPSPTVGVNTYHSLDGNRTFLFQPDETHKVTKLEQWLAYHESIANYRAVGGKYIRTIQSVWSSLIEFEKKGNYYDRQPYAWEQDKLLEYCEQNGISVYFNLMQQEPFMKYGNYDFFDWDFSHYHHDTYDVYDKYPAYCYSDGKNKEPYEMFLDADDMRYHEQRTRYYISRYGYSTSIYLFELLSEPWHLNQVSGKTEPLMEATPLGDSVRKALRNYHETMAAYIKKDLGHTEHLVGIDLLCPLLYTNDLCIDQSVYSPNIDVIAFNPYAKTPEKLVIAKNSENNLVTMDENSMYKTVHSIHEKAGKPLLIAEGGMGDNYFACGDFSGQYVDMMTFGFCGLAGFNSWIGSFAGQEKLLPPIVVAQEFLNSDKLKRTLSGDWTQGRQVAKQYGRQKKRAKELQYYVGADGLSAAGYVRNRTFNYYTTRTDSSCYDKEMETAVPFNQLTDITWDEGTEELVVTGLEKRMLYTVEWFDYKTGEKLLTQSQRSGRSAFVLKYPALSVTDPGNLHPVLWFVIRDAWDLPKTAGPF